MRARKKVLKERQLEAQMVQSLSAIFGPGKVNYQEREKNGRVDIIVDGRYAIELKVMNSSFQLTSIVGQVMKYSQEYERVFLWMYDIRSQLKTKDVNDFNARAKQASVNNLEIYPKKGSFYYMSNANFLLILRGVPGVGKTQVGKELKKMLAPNLI